jgi:hypothetical protein
MFLSERTIDGYRESLFEKPGGTGHLFSVDLVYDYYIPIGGFAGNAINYFAGEPYYFGVGRRIVATKRACPIQAR